MHPVHLVSRPRAVLLALLLAGAAWSPVLAQSGSAGARLPSLGDSSSDDLDVAHEKRLGDTIMRDLRKDPDYLEDPVLQAYLDGLLSPLLQAARERNDIDPDLARRYAWQGFLVRDRAVNAFALPGGYIGVYLGLIALTATPDELASVLAHELTHVTQRHIARSISNSSRQTMAAMAGMLLGVLAAAKANSVDGVQAAVVGSQALMAQGQLNFSRDMEREADRIGLDLMGSAGYSVRGMSGMFEKLDGASRLNDGGNYPYLRSHPLTSERITEARLRAEGAPGQPTDHLLLHALMQARARTLADPSVQALRRWQAAGALGSPAGDRVRQAALYAGALASVRLRDFDLAGQQIAAGQALAAQPGRESAVAQRQWALLHLEWWTARGGAAASWPAWAAAEAALARDPSREALLVRSASAQARQRAGDPTAPAALRELTEQLQTWVTEHRRDAPAWDALAGSAQPLGLSLRALQAGAEAAWSRGDVMGAVDRFRAAQQEARRLGPQQYQEAAIIESRLREADAERRRLLAEQRGERVPD